MKLVLCAALLYLLVLGSRSAWTRFRRRPIAPALRRQRALAGGALLLMVVFWVGLVGFLIASGILDTGFGATVPLTLRVLLVLPWLTVALTLASAWATLPIFRVGVAGVFDRALAVLFVPLMAVVLAAMAYWKVLGVPW